MDTELLFLAYLDGVQCVVSRPELKFRAKLDIDNCILERRKSDLWGTSSRIPR